jgi:predicted Abi (CAAX) family protease
VDQRRLAIWAKALLVVAVVIAVAAGLIFGYVLVVPHPEHRGPWTVWATIGMLLAFALGAAGNILWQKRRILLRHPTDSP